MILIENIQVVGFEPAIRGMRNPMNSWEKSDSEFEVDCSICDNPHYDCEHCPTHAVDSVEHTLIGPNDHDLMMRLAKQGPVHGKFRRMIVAYMDITAPLYWWKEFDTYKVGTVANSCSTMHKIQAKEFTLDDFSHEHLEGALCYEEEPEKVYSNYGTPLWILQTTIAILNEWREIFNNGGVHLWKGEEHEFTPKDKDAWWQMIQLLPSSYNQKRTVMLNYEVVANIRQYRGNHKLDEWREFCQVIDDLPYSEIITCGLGDEDDA